VKAGTIRNLMQQIRTQETLEKPNVPRDNRAVIAGQN